LDRAVGTDDTDYLSSRVIWLERARAHTSTGDNVGRSEIMPVGLDPPPEEPEPDSMDYPL
jgi:hypothetical protein